MVYNVYPLCATIMGSLAAVMDLIDPKTSLRRGDCVDYKRFASDLPGHLATTFESAEENEETMQAHGIEQRVRQLGRGPFRADVAARQIDQALFFVDRFSRACSMYLEGAPGMVSLVFFRSAGGALHASGSDVANDKLVVLPGGTGTDLWTPDLAGSEAIGIPESRFAQIAEAICPTIMLPDVMTVIEGDTRALNALKAAVLGLVAHPERSVEPEQLSGLIAQAIAFVADSSDGGFTEGRVFNEARMRAAKRAQDYIEAHYREAVHLEDLCRAAGVSARTLQRSFREYFRVSVTEYLKTLRLDSARRALAIASPADELVSSVALRHGFTHLGRFSVAYRQRYGVSPRETLARQSTTTITSTH